ncbi:MAG: AcrR family transcriptional regulator [Flavobacterium sp.]
MPASIAIGKQQAKSIRAREAICEATIGLLVEFGYAETSLNRVASKAGFSKGALQHHYPSKEDLIAATLNRLLERPFKRARNPVKNAEEALMVAWTKYINTPAYRALLEIFNAARTDDLLQTRIADELLDWGRALDEQSLEQYEAISGDDDEVVMLLNMTRSFMRGLLVQESYGNDRVKSLLYIKKWISLISPLIKLRVEELRVEE